MYDEYEVVIGLEVHVELKTDSKIFCACSTRFGAEPNTQVCPVCSGFPGMLPVLNEKVVEYAIKAGLALNCEIAQLSKFDRKNYFYPDLPNAYQISQYDYPVCKQGYLDIELEGSKKRIAITRAHLEEDAGKLVHQGDIASTPYSLVDLNRCGVPLLEIVSEPDMRSAAEARAYMEKIRSLLLFVGVSDCKMEEGSLRCDANISVRPKGTEKLGVRAEVKNLNSFRSLEKAIEYEIVRHIEAIEDGEALVQETRTWDEEKQITKSMRSKEEAHDYRYFPDPDLPLVWIDADMIANIKANLPELPEAAQKRLINEHNLSEYDAQILTQSPAYLKFFDDTLKIYPQAKLVANWMMGEFNKLLKQNNLEIENSKVSPENLAKMLKLIEDGSISGKMAKDIFAQIFISAQDVEQIIQEKGLVQISDTKALQALLTEVLQANATVVEDYKQGKEKAMGYLVGQAMKASKGQANPAIVNKLLKELLN